MWTNTFCYVKDYCVAVLCNDVGSEYLSAHFCNATLYVKRQLLCNIHILISSIMSKVQWKILSLTHLPDYLKYKKPDVVAQIHCKRYALCCIQSWGIRGGKGVGGHTLHFLVLKIGADITTLVICIPPILWRTNWPTIKHCIHFFLYLF